MPGTMVPSAFVLGEVCPDEGEVRMTVPLTDLVATGLMLDQRIRVHTDACI